MSSDIINQSHDEYMRKCRSKQKQLDKLPVSRVYKKTILEAIGCRWKIFDSSIGRTASGKGQINIECWHGDCERIGQFVLRVFPKQVQTYFSCHLFRHGRLSIYFKK